MAVGNGDQLVTIATICRNPHSLVDSNNKPKIFVDKWAQTIVTIDDRLVHPSEYVEAKGGTRLKPEDGYVLFIQNPIRTESDPTTGRINNILTSQVFGKVLLHKYQGNNCGSCRQKFKESNQWWLPQLHINNADRLDAYQKDEMDRFADIARQVVGQ